MDGYIVKQIKGSTKFQVWKRPEDGKGVTMYAALPEGCVDWALDKVKDGAHKRFNEVFAFSPSKQAKSVWMNKLAWQPMPDDDEQPQPTDTEKMRKEVEAQVRAEMEEEKKKEAEAQTDLLL